MCGLGSNQMLKHTDFIEYIHDIYSVSTFILVIEPPKNPHVAQ